MLALVMSAVGIYAAMSYTMQQRTQEFGVRIALGASRTTIFSLALGQATRLGIAGTALGLGMSFVLARILGNALYPQPANTTG